MAAPLSYTFICWPPARLLPLRLFTLQPQDECFHYSDKFCGSLSLPFLALFIAKLFTYQEKGLFSDLMKMRLNLVAQFVYHSLPSKTFRAKLTYPFSAAAFPWLPVQRINFFLLSVTLRSCQCPVICKEF